MPARFSHTWIENRFPKFQAHDPEVKFMFVQHLLHLIAYYGSMNGQLFMGVRSYYKAQFSRFFDQLRLDQRIGPILRQLIHEYDLFYLAVQFVLTPNDIGIE